MSRKLVAGNPAYELLCNRTFGCSVNEYWEIRGNLPYRRSPIEKYVTQRRAAKDRGVDWEFTLVTWWTMWQESGLWERRGKSSASYVMGRFNDIGPYSPGNVYFTTGAENCSVSVQRTNLKMYGNRIHA